MAELIVTPIKLIILTHYRLFYIFNENNLMTLQQSVAAIARQEVLSPTWGVVQILAVHKLVILDGVPSIARIDDTREPGVFYIYFPLENQDYFLVIMVESSNSEFVVSGSYVEADVRVYLIVDSDLLEPDVITALIGIKPTSTHKKGELRTPKTTLLCRANLWIFEPQKDVPDELERKLSFLLAQLENVATNLSSLSEQCDIYINVIYTAYQEQMGGWQLDRKTMSQILSLGADVDLTIYARGSNLLI